MDGRIILEKYLEKKIDLEIKLAELFILTILAGMLLSLYLNTNG